MLFAKILLLLLPLLPSEGKWQRINTNEKISFLFPYKPEILNKLNSNIPSTIYQTKNLTCVFGVVCSNMSGKIEINPENAQNLYEEFKKSSLSLETAKLKSERTVPFENMLIKEIIYTIIKDYYEMTYIKRFIFRDNYIYQISIGGRSRFLDEIKKEGEILFNSINFPETPESSTIETINANIPVK